MNNKSVTPLSLQAELSALIHRSARERDYIINDAIMVEKLSQTGEKYTADWLFDSEFLQTFKGNMVGYYLGICVNCLCGGLSCADAWADGDNRLDSIKYDEIYDGGVWNNVFVLLQMTEKWVVLLKDYFKNDNANEYILKTLSAFFQLGVSLRLDILGY